MKARLRSVVAAGVVAAGRLVYSSPLSGADAERLATHCYQETKPRACLLAVTTTKLSDGQELDRIGASGKFSRVMSRSILSWQPVPGVTSEVRIGEVRLSQRDQVFPHEVVALESPLYQSKFYPADDEVQLTHSMFGEPGLVKILAWAGSHDTADPVFLPVDLGTTGSGGLVILSFLVFHYCAHCVFYGYVDVKPDDADASQWHELRDAVTIRSLSYADPNAAAASAVVVIDFGSDPGGVYDVRLRLGVTGTDMGPEGEPFERVTRVRYSGASFRESRKARERAENEIGENLARGARDGLANLDATAHKLDLDNAAPGVRYPVVVIQNALSDAVDAVVSRSNGPRGAAMRAYLQACLAAAYDLLHARDRPAQESACRPDSDTRSSWDNDQSSRRVHYVMDGQSSDVPRDRALEAVTFLRHLLKRLLALPPALTVDLCVGSEQPGVGILIRPAVDPAADVPFNSVRTNATIFGLYRGLYTYGEPHGKFSPGLLNLIDSPWSNLRCAPFAGGVACALTKQPCGSP